MAIELRDEQHELMDEAGTLSLLFGTSDTGYLTTMTPTADAGDAITGDVPRVREDGTAFGEDYLPGKTLTFELGVLSDRSANPHRDGLDALDRLEGMWKHPRFRASAASYAVLRSRVAGNTVRCYGRPRRYADTPGLMTKSGWTPVVADFALMDGRWYDDIEQVQGATLATSTDGGMVAPLRAPLTTVAASEPRTAAFTIGGSTSTWPVVTFNGPVTNPGIDFGPFKVGLLGTIGEGLSITIDPRPWARTVLRNDGASKAGMLTYETPPLRRMLLDPGTYVLDYRGIDNTGTSSASVAWRNARNRP